MDDTIHTAIAGLIILGMSGAATTAYAVENDKVKCYGIAKKGMNDCQTATSACTGTSKVNAQGDAFILVPKGTCEKIVGASRNPQSENDITKVETGS